MADLDACGDVRDVLPELALGLLSGPERADAIAHVLRCPSCRSELQELADVTDRLLQLAPESEPPPGFENAVLERLAGAPAPVARSRRPRGRALVAAATAVVLLLGAAAGGGVWLGRASTRSHDLYAAAMRTGQGREVGEVWLYDGEPAWLFVSVPGWSQWTDTGGDKLAYKVRVTLDDGARIELDDVAWQAGSGSWGATAPVDVNRVRTVSVVDTTGRVWCTGRFA